jgi:flagellin
MIINNNISAENASRVSNINSKALDSVMAKLSSGRRINVASDDPSGLAVSEKMSAQVGGLNRASKNASDGFSFLQTAEGYLSETSNILKRVREIAVQSGNGIYSDSDRMQVQVEVSQLLKEVDRVSSHAQFNGFAFLTGRFAQGNQSLRFHIGSDTNQFIEVNVASSDLKSLGLVNSAVGGVAISMSTADKANSSLAVIDQALIKVTKQRADLGALQSRMNYMVTGIDIASQNTLAAQSNISDADMAEEMVKYTRDSILNQTSLAMLTQANNKNQSVIRLLG